MWSVAVDSPCHYIMKDRIVRVDFDGSRETYHGSYRVINTHKAEYNNHCRRIRIDDRSSYNMYSPSYINRDQMCSICIHYI